MTADDEMLDAGKVSRPLKCSICGKPADQSYRPFCSKRCADIDLGRWLKGGYAIAGGGADADEDGDASFEGIEPSNEEEP
jgi:endogenous inhibitor of DNA gyrase (YacG/DUF329 family)